jgi:hydrogenase maturation protease
MLRTCLPPEIPLICLTQPLELVDHLRGCERVYLIDAADGGGPPGTIVRLQWPDPRISAEPTGSSHGLGLAAALQLAESLGCLPPLVIVFAMQFERMRGTLRLSQRVATALPELSRRILEEVNGFHHPDPAGGG